jgi:hypothetical protein
MKRSLVDDADLGLAWSYEFQRYHWCRKYGRWSKADEALDALKFYQMRLKGHGVEMPEVG